MYSPIPKQVAENEKRTKKPRAAEPIRQKKTIILEPHTYCRPGFITRYSSHTLSPIYDPQSLLQNAKLAF